MEIDPSPARPNDELEFIELTGIDDDALDQQLAAVIRALGIMANNVPDIKPLLETALMMLAQQLPTQLEFQFDRTSKLENTTYERLLGLLEEAIQSGNYSKLRRLSMSFARLRHLESTNSLHRDVAKECSRTGSI